MKTTFCGWRILVSTLVFTALAAVLSARAESAVVNLAAYLAARTGTTQAAIAQDTAYVPVADSYKTATATAWYWHLFDGLSFYKTGTIRLTNTDGWMSTLSNDPCIQFTIPATSRVTGFTLTSYTIHRLCNGWNSRDRAPTAWTLEGSSNGVDWVTIDSQTGVVWGGTQTYSGSGGGTNPEEKDCHQTFIVASAPAYSRFRFKPTASDHTGSAPNVGLNELELWGVPEIAELQVFHGIDKVEDVSVFPLEDGGYVAAAGTITAPAAVYRLCGLRYRPIGYALEEVESGTVTTNLESTAYDYVPDGKLRCLTWLWAFAGMSESVNYHTIATAYDGEVSYEGGTSGKDYEANLGPDRCFDGTTLTDNANLRYTGKVNSHVALMVTGLKLEDEVKLVPVSYRLWQQSTGYYCNERAPTGWRLEGSNDGGSTWEVIDEVSDYTWYSQTNSAVYGTGQLAKSPWEKNPNDGEKNSATFEIEEGEPFLSYRLVFTRAKYMEGYTSQQTSGWDAGLMEIEIFVKAKLDQAKVEIAGAPAQYAGAGLEYGEFYLPPAGDDFSAPEVGFYDGAAALCRGYVLERKSGEEWELVETNLTARAVHLDGDSGDCRLTWLWEKVASAVRMEKDEGRETFVYDPAPDYVDAEGVRYYRYGRQLQITPVGATEPTVSTFAGDIDGDTEGVTVAEGVLTFVVGAPRTIKVNFSRHWKFLPAGGSETYARVTDGNWVLRVRDDTTDLGEGEYAPNQHFRTLSTAGTGEPKTRVAGSGRLDFSLLNADLREQTAAGAKPLLMLATGAFREEHAITEVIIPEEMASMSSAVFCGCGNLMAATVLSDMSLWRENTGTEGVFTDCTKLQRVSFPRATKLFKYMFKNCKGLAKLQFSSNLTELAVGAFEGAKFELLNLARTHVTALPENCFYLCDFGRIVLPEGLTTIGKYALVVKDPNPARLREVEFRGVPPTSLHDNWSNAQGVNTNFKIAIAVQRKYVSDWETANFDAKGTITNERSQPYYDEVSAVDRLYLGAWRNKWLVVRKIKGLILTWD